MEVDKLIESGVIKDEVFAQIGQSDYQPKNYKYKAFIDAGEYENLVNSSDLIITHGGTGAIVKALKAEKQTIAVPRQCRYKEHEDDHQFQIVDFFATNKYILKVEDIAELELKIEEIKRQPIIKKFIGDGHVIEIIDEFIEAHF